jgi:transposase-like protein
MIKRRHRIWTEGEKLTVVLEADRDGAETVAKKYNIARTLLRRWRGPRPRLSGSQLDQRKVDQLRIDQAADRSKHLARLGGAFPRCAPRVPIAPVSVLDIMFE